MEQVLPEDCISRILSFTTPRDVCRSSTVSPVFRSAADSNYVWEKFLPSDIHQILSSSSVSPPLPNFASKRELFLHLCDNPLLIDSGTKTLALEKCSGKKCYMIGARALSIIWGSSPEYWEWKPYPESRFSEVAELLSVCWLEIRGRMETRLLSPKTTYGAYLVFKFTERVSGLRPLAEVSVRLATGTGGAEEGEVRSVSLNPAPEGPQATRDWWMEIGMDMFFNERGEDGEVAPEGPQERRDWWMEIEMDEFFNERGEDGEVAPEGPQERRDGWMEIEMGEFFNERGEDGEVEMSLKEIRVLYWKSGLIIHGIELRPKENQPV